MFTATIDASNRSAPERPETLSQRVAMLCPMTTARQTSTSTTASIEPSADGEQLRLALPTGTTARRPVARQLPAQLRLDARTRRVGRVGIAEIRRILAEAGTATGVDAGARAA